MFKITNRAIVTKQLKEIFANHIGINNPISSENLFIKITGINPSTQDYYERAYKWNAIKRILGILRKNGELFVIMGTSHHYVLSDKEELNAYKNKVDATIKGLHNIKKKADKWVKSDELKKLQDKKILKTTIKEDKIKNDI